MEAGDEQRRRGADGGGDARDEPALPIMHWEALSLRIAELEKQEEEKRDKAAKGCAAALERGPEWREDGRRRHRRLHDAVADESAPGSRLQTQMNLQLCFINNSESDEQEEEDERHPEEAVASAACATKGSAAAGHKTAAPATKPDKSKSRGLRGTWRKLRERLRADHKPPDAAEPAPRGRRLEPGDVRKLSLAELRAQRSFLAQTAQDLSSALVAGLQARDQLRTERDALLLELQDLASVGGAPAPGAHG